MLLDSGESSFLVAYNGRTWVLIDSILPALESRYFFLQLLLEFLWKDSILDKELQAKNKRPQNSLNSIDQVFALKSLSIAIAGSGVAWAHKSIGTKSKASNIDAISSRTSTYLSIAQFFTAKGRTFPSLSK